MSPRAIQASHRQWTLDEIASLRSVYETAKCSLDLRLDELAKTFGRDKANVCRKARELGLTDNSRAKLNIRKMEQTSIFRDPVLQAARVGVVMSAYIKHVGHPKGMLGKKHTPESLAEMGAASRRRWADPNSKLRSEAEAQRRSDNGVRNNAAGVWGHNGANPYSRAKHGRRADLGGRFFRSAWEANYARYLTWLVTRGEIASWDYECHTFWFLEIKRGVRSYKPDFKVIQQDGRHEWHEVKGWMDPKSRVKLARMAKYYPAEVVKVIGATWFRDAARNLAGLLPGWERA